MCVDDVAINICQALPAGLRAPGRADRARRQQGHGRHFYQPGGGEVRARPRQGHEREQAAGAGGSADPGRAVQVETRVCKHGIRRPSLWVSDSMQPPVCDTL